MSKDTKRHLFQVRRKEPRAGRRDPYYTPERDLAHVGQFLVAGAVRAVDCLPFPDSPHNPDDQNAVKAELQEPWLTQFITENGLTYQAIIDSKAPLLLAQALNLIVKSEHPPAAMKEVGFDQLPAAMQMLFYCRLGQVFLAAVWAGIKDVSRADSDPPASFEELLDSVNEAFQGFLGQEDHATECLPLGNGTVGVEESGPSRDDPSTAPVQ